MSHKSTARIRRNKVNVSLRVTETGGRSDRSTQTDLGGASLAVCLVTLGCLLLELIASIAVPIAIVMWLISGFFQ